MIDTNLTNRQKAVLDLLEKKGASSRADIEKALSAEQSVSRITVIRDLNFLVEGGYVTVSERGRATKYLLRQKNPLLREVNINDYFRKSVSERKVRRSFNDRVYKNLAGLFSKQEQDQWDKAGADYAERIKKLDPAIYRRELERFIIEFSWKSSQIEGNTYDLLETETLIKQRIEAKGRSREEAIMILNHKDAFDAVLKRAGTFKSISFHDVTQLHGLMIKGLRVPTGIRSQAVRITGTLYTPISIKGNLEDELRKVISHINKIKFPPEKALIAASMIAYLQPFADGNKRTSRMLANAILLAYGYYPLSYRDVDVNEYQKAIILFYELNNLFYLKRIFMEQMRFSANNYFQL